MLKTRLVKQPEPQQADAGRHRDRRQRLVRQLVVEVVPDVVVEAVLVGAHISTPRMYTTVNTTTQTPSTKCQYQATDSTAPR